MRYLHAIQYRVSKLASVQPSARIILLKISFSQNSEDDFIRSFFWQEILEGKKGTYLDIGCFHESLYSNTKLLSLVGWHGLGVDANIDMMKPWIDARPLDKFLHYCLVPSSSISNDITFYRFALGEMSTAIPERAAELVSKGWKPLDKVSVPSITFSNLAKNAIALGFTKPDLVSIDLEMIDYLQDLPCFLQMLEPRLLCMECISQNINLKSLLCSKECKVLESADYEIIAFLGGNIFAKKKNPSVTIF